MMRMASGAKDTKGFAVSSTISFSSEGLTRSFSTERDIPKRYRHYGFLPLANSLEYEGLYNEFYFDIGLESEKIFSPKYSYCKSADPLSKEQEHYLVVGLTSKYDGEGIVKHGRNPFNLVVAIDISGSMTSTFHTGDDVRSKMEITLNSVLSIISLLKPGDRFGCVSFNDNVSELQELKPIEEIHVPKLKQTIVSLKASGGTALTAAMKKSTSMFAGVKNDKEKYQASENTIIILTDLVPTKDVSTNTFVTTVKRNAQERLYTTIVGIGSEFSSDLLKRLGTIRSCNYHSVHSAQDFKQIIDHEFIYTLSPSAFDVALTIDSDKFSVERVYGSPGNEYPMDDGAMLTMDCNSPSPVDDSNRTKGGIVLAKLKLRSPLTADTALTCRLEYKDRNGEKYTDEQKVEVPFQPDQPNFYNGEAGRKSILLTRYINLIKQWILDEQKRFHATESEDSEIHEAQTYRPTITSATGILPIEKGRDPNQTKRIPFYVDSHYAALFSAFVTHFKEEISALNDTGLENCVQKLEGIASYKELCCATTKEAVEQEHVRCLSILTKSGNSVEMTPQQADTIILKTIQQGRLSLLETLWPLVEKTLHEDKKLAYVKRACESGRPKILHLLMSYLPSYDAPKPTSVSFFQKLITPIPPLTPAPHPELAAAILQAAQKGNVKCLRQMLTFAPIDLNSYAKLALPNAYSYGKSECVKFLIDRGAVNPGITLKDVQRDLDGDQDKTNKNEVDLVFCCDCTGSMGLYLESAQSGIRDIVTEIATKGESNVRFSLVKYKDHQPDNAYATEVHEFTYELNRMKAYVDTMEASGGNDCPECLVDGMEACLNLNFRPNATKIVCIITDAPPHALDPKSDDFPDGCPCGFDPLQIARLMAERGIIIYSLGAEPLTNFTRDFLTAVAHMTEGQYVPLAAAVTLRQVIVGGTIEELDLKRVMHEVQAQYDSIKSMGLDEDDAIMKVTESLQKQQLKVNQLVLQDVYSGKDTTNIAIYTGANTLLEARTQIQIGGRERTNVSNSGKYQTEQQVISLKQVARVWNRLKK